jgi:hypothetical protein
VVFVENAVAADDRQIFCLSLRDQHSVKGIYVDTREHAGSQTVVHRDGKVR